MTVKLEKHFKNIQSTIYNSFEELETSNTVNISKSMLCLPIYPDLSLNEQSYVINSIRNIYSDKKD